MNAPNFISQGRLLRQQFCKVKIGESGYTFIEVLIANCILVFSLLSLAILSATILHRIQDAHWRSMAVAALNNVAQRVNAHDKGCANWLEEYARELPGGEGHCVVDHYFYELSLCYRSFHVPKECIHLHGYLK